MVYELYFSNKRDEMYFCSYAPSPPFYPFLPRISWWKGTRREDGTRIHVSRCRTNKKIFPKINRGKREEVGSVTYYCETRRVEKYRDIQNVRKNISLPSQKEIRILFNYENVHLSRDNVLVKYRNLLKIHGSKARSHGGL